MSEEPDHSDSSIDPADALSNIQDDDTPKREALRWAADEMIKGMAAEELLSQLVAEGWDTDDAEQIVETARKDTRRERGVLTRDDVVRDLNVNYRRATSGLSVAFRGGLFGLYGFTAGVMAALRSMRKLKRMRRK